MTWHRHYHDQSTYRWRHLRTDHCSPRSHPNDSWNPIKGFPLRSWERLCFNIRSEEVIWSRQHFRQVKILRLLKANTILSRCFWMIFFKNIAIFSEQFSLLLFDDVSLSSFFLFSSLSFSKFHGSLSFIHFQFFSPKSLNFLFMFKLFHSSSLSVHLFDSIVFSKLFHHLLFKFFLDSLFF